MIYFATFYLFACELCLLKLDYNYLKSF